MRRHVAFLLTFATISICGCGFKACDGWYTHRESYSQERVPQTVSAPQREYEDTQEKLSSLKRQVEEAAQIYEKVAAPSDDPLDARDVAPSLVLLKKRINELDQLANLAANNERIFVNQSGGRATIRQYQDFAKSMKAKYGA
jgi:hypothetical protein